MRSVTYSMGVSLDGYIVGPDGGFDWIDARHRMSFASGSTRSERSASTCMGRRLYETMLYWETADQAIAR